MAASVDLGWPSVAGINQLPTALSGTAEVYGQSRDSGRTGANASCGTRFSAGAAGGWFRGWGPGSGVVVGGTPRRAVRRTDWLGSDLGSWEPAERSAVGRRGS